jgi:hypothetical protein
LQRAALLSLLLFVAGWGTWGFVALTVLSRWMGRVCGEWAPPESKWDPRCGGSITLWAKAGIVVGWVGLGGLVVSCGILGALVIRQRVHLARGARSVGEPAPTQRGEGPPPGGPSPPDEERIDSI